MFFFNSSVFPPVVAWRRVFLLSFFRQGFDTLLTGGCSHGTHGTGRPLHRPRDAPRQPDEVPPGPRPWTQAGHSGVKIFGNNYGIYFVIPISPFFSQKPTRVGVRPRVFAVAGTGASSRFGTGEATIEALLPLTVQSGAAGSTAQTNPGIWLRPAAGFCSHPNLTNRAKFSSLDHQRRVFLMSSISLM